METYYHIVLDINVVDLLSILHFKFTLPVYTNMK